MEESFIKHVNSYFADIYSTITFYGIVIMIVLGLFTFGYVFGRLSW